MYVHLRSADDRRTLVFLYMMITGAQTMQYFIPTLVGIFGWEDWEGQCELSTSPKPLQASHGFTNTKARSYDPTIRLGFRLHALLLLHLRLLQEQAALHLALRGHQHDSVHHH